MQSPLVTYLHDHLAGSSFAVELLKSLHDQHPNSLGVFANDMLTDVRKDQATLLSIVDRVGEGHFDLYEIGGWIAEKMSRLKLREDGAAIGIGTLEAVETLALGVQGKLALWRSLQTLQPTDLRVSGFDFAELASSAQEQFKRVEEQRLSLAAAVLPLPGEVKDVPAMPTATGAI